MSLLCGFLATIAAPTVNALGPNFFDNTSTTDADCDVWDANASDAMCNRDSKEVTLIAGETSHVPQQRVHVKAYFDQLGNGASPDPTEFGPNKGPAIIISGYAFCPTTASGVENRDLLNYGKYEGKFGSILNKDVTRYVLGTGYNPATDKFSSQVTTYGAARSAGSSQCHDKKTVRVPRNLLTKVRGVPSLWEVDFLATENQFTGATSSTCRSSSDASCDGVANGFRITETNLDGSGRNKAFTAAAANDQDAPLGYGVTIRNNSDYTGGCSDSQHRNGTCPENLSYKLRFGSDCTVPEEGKVVQIAFYDVDYAMDSQGPLKARLYDGTARQWKTPDRSDSDVEASSDDVATGVHWQPNKPTFDEADRFKSQGNATQSFWFKAMPTHSYTLEFLNNNQDLVFQYGLPFDGIYYSHPATAINCNQSVSPSIEFDQNQYAAGDPATITARLQSDNPAQPGYVSSAKVTVWYDNDGSGDYTGKPAVPVAGLSGPRVPTNPIPGSPGWSVSGTTDVTGGYAYICAKIDNIVALDGTTVDPPDAASCQRIVNSPYLSIYGGDAAAGTGPTQTAAGSTVCLPSNPDAGFLSWNQGADGGWAGAGVQFAAQALGEINNFASAQNSNATGGADPPTGLSFSNTMNINLPSGLFGGKYGSTDGINCDYTSDLGSATASPGNFTVPSNLNDGTHLTNYFRGDVYIRGNMAYANGTWSDITKIPSYRLVTVGGNIIIDKDVSTLIGTFVAEPDSNGNGGTIFTCGVPSTVAGEIGEPVNTDGGLYDDCNNQLTIYGSFVAKDVRFLRASGTVSQATNSTDYKGSGAAERFVLSPAYWLGNLDNSMTGPDASYTGLPPVL